MIHHICRPFLNVEILFYFSNQSLNHRMMSFLYDYDDDLVVNAEDVNSSIIAEPKANADVIAESKANHHDEPTVEQSRVNFDMADNDLDDSAFLNIQC